MGEDNDLGSLLEGLSEHDGVGAATLVGRDGFTVESAGGGLDAESFAAVLSASVAAAAEMGSDLEVGDFKLSMLEYQGGVILACSVGPDAILGIYAEPGANLGLIRFKARKISRVIMENL